MRPALVSLPCSILLALVASAPLAAQQPIAAADTGAPVPIRWSLTAGSGLGPDGTTRPHVAAGAWWQSRRTGFGTRLELAYSSERDAMPILVNGGVGEQCLDCSEETSSHRVGVAASLSYEFRRGRSVRPYLLSGAGIHRGRTRTTLTDPSSAEEGGPLAAGCSWTGASRTCTRGVVHTSLHGATGVAWSLGRLDLLGELRFEALSGAGTFIRPTIGIRF